ncbi:LysR family transcriptional regulator [Sinomonas flava]|uniref:LysR family transcriptional regulator n=1 Tax=Sinomonas flava TaxID=496857 RepID=UPI0039A5E2A4
MNLRRLEYFVAVVEAGSVSSAAERLHMTQPPLSQAILALERELGTSLLHRLPRGVQPTSAGRLLAEQGRHLLERAERLEDQVRRTGQGLEGTVSVASVPTFMWSHLPALLAEFKASHPGIAVEISDPDPTEVLRIVAAGGADAGFVATSDPAVVAAAHPGLEVVGLAPVPLVLVVPRGLARREASARDFADQTWIVPAPPPGFVGMVEIAEEVWRKAGFRPASIQQVTTLPTALPLVPAGLGVCLLPEQFVADFTGDVAVQPLLEDIPPLHGTLVHSREAVPTPALAAFLATVHAHFGARDGAGPAD